MRLGLYLQNLDEEYQISVYRGIRDQAQIMNIDLVCIQGERIGWPNITEETYFPSRRFLQVDGALLLTPTLIDQADLLSSIHLRDLFEAVPCLSIGNRLSDMPSIIIRCRQSMESILEHLVDYHGYRRLLYIGGISNHWDNIVRENIFRRFINSRQKSLPELMADIRHGAFHEYSGMIIMREYIESHRDKPLDAVVAANDNMAIGVLKALQTHANSVWRRCAVTGFDDIPQAALEEPALTTVRQPLELMGRRAVETLYDLIIGNEPIPVIRIDSSPQIRASCGCPRLDRHSPPVHKAAVFNGRYAQIQYQTIRSEQQLRLVSFLGQRLTMVDTIAESLVPLDEFLDNLEIREYFLLLFRQPAPAINERAALVYERRLGVGKIVSNAVSPDSRLPAESVMINIADFFANLGPSLEPAGPSAHCVYHLRSGTEYLGLVVYEAADDVHPYLCSGAMYFANTIKRLHLMADEKERNRYLEQQVALRTRDLVETNEKLQREASRRLAVEAEVLRISEMERLRFSLDLHDDICQRLAGISMYSKSIYSLDQVRGLSEMLDETLSLTRRYAHAAFPMELDSLGLNKALETLCQEVETQTGRSCLYVWEADSELSPLSSAQDINIYRIVQEALHNAVAHSGASVIEINIRLENGTLVVRIKDDGVGNSALATDNSSQKKSDKYRRGLGLRSMRYRAHQLGAEYLFQSSESEGTLVEVRIPLSNPSQTTSAVYG